MSSDSSGIQSSQSSRGKPPRKSQNPSRGGGTTDKGATAKDSQANKASQKSSTSARSGAQAQSARNGGQGSATGGNGGQRGVPAAAGRGRGRGQGSCGTRGAASVAASQAQGIAGRGRGRELSGKVAQGACGTQNQERRQRIIYPFTSHQLKALIKEMESGEIKGIELIRKLTVDGRLAETINAEGPSRSLDDRSNILLLVAAGTEVHFNDCRQLLLDLLKTVMTSSFLEKSAQFFRRNVEQFMNGVTVALPDKLLRDLISIMTILIDLMDKFPTNTQSYDSAVSEVKNALREIQDHQEDIRDKTETFKELMELWNKFKEAWDIVLKNKNRHNISAARNLKSGKSSEAESNPPPDNFRDLDVFPSKNDILDTQKPYLRKNLVEGGYKDVDTYLDVQFRLLREDYIAPLRKGIQAFKTGGRGKNKDIRTYGNITIQPPVVDKRTGQVACIVQCKEQHFRKINWAVSKRLLQGALVCFSSDNFQDDLIFATVFNRDPLAMMNGQMEVYFERPESVNFRATYIMAESDAYFEAYRHVLLGLKMMQGDKMPFAKYLVACDPNVAPPKYMRMQSQLDFSPVIKEELQGTGVNFKRNVFNRLAWPSNESMGLDNSQAEAVFQALTKELSIIQGPPGTGKTFIGWQITRLLLHNEKMWNQDGKHPILVVCYTNHALDQFLEGILRFQKEGIIRVGGRCNNEEMSKCLLNNIRKESRYPRDLGTAIYNCRRAQEVVEDRMNSQGARLRLLREELPTFELLSPTYDLLSRSDKADPSKLILEKHIESFLIGPLSHGLPDWGVNQQLVYWLDSSPDDYKEGDETMMNPEIIRELMRLGIPELLAKMAALISGNDSVSEAINAIMGDDPNLYSPVYGAVVNTWPFLDDLYHLVVNLGFPEQVVLHAYCTVGENNVEAVLRLLQGFGFDETEQDNGEDRFQTPPEEFPDQETIKALKIGPDDLTPNRDLDFDVYNDNTNVGHNALGGSSSFVNTSLKVMKQERNGNFLNLDKTLVLVNKALHKGRGAGNRWMALDSWQTVDREGKEVVSKKTSAHAKKMKRDILMTKPMTEAQADGVNDVWALQLPDRWRLYRLWTKKYGERLDASLRETVRAYGEVTAKLRETRSLGDVEIMRKAKVIGMTTTGAAKYQGVLQTIQPRIVIMEEAAEVLEAHLVTSLSAGCQQAILIGDHQQLKPNPAVYELAVHYNMDVSLFERLIKNKFEHSQLKLQHRMRPEISRALMPHFYKDLLDDESVMDFDDIKGMQKNLFFVNHGEPEAQEGDTSSRKNINEANWVVNIVKYLMQQEYKPEDITILVAYSGQYFETKKLLKEKLKIAQDDQILRRVKIVDNYQGEECDIVILSLVRSNSEGSIGFLKVPNRVCVAMSRAKKGFYIMGNMDHLKAAERDKYKTELWTGICSSLTEREAIGDALQVQCEMHGNKEMIRSPEEFFKKCPEGGCNEPCNVRMKCGHVCEKQCHSYDLEHTGLASNCMKPCERLMPCQNPEHKCKKRCYKECGVCMYMVEKILPCGHKMDVHCFVDPVDVICSFPCPIVLQCGHYCKQPCSRKCTENCTETVEKALPCGHTLKAKCCMANTDIFCTEMVTKQWPGCGHRKEVHCSTDVLKIKCGAPCRMTLTDCDHECKGTCGKCRGGRLHVTCTQPCKRVLVCGHECEAKCCKGCPPCPKPCETVCEHSQCGKAGKVKGKKGKAHTRGRTCGEICPFCMEKCKGMCDHNKCDKRCFEPCKLPLCMERCDKQLNCKHNNQLEKKTRTMSSEIELKKKVVKMITDRKSRSEEDEKKLKELVETVEELSSDLEKLRQENRHICIGVCGEPCIPVCKVCDKETFEKIRNPEIPFGSEDDDDAIFVQLRDCKRKCVMEVHDMDTWVNTQLGNSQEGGKKEIIMLVCPRCKTPIRNSRRYGGFLKQQFKDISRAKMVITGNDRELRKTRSELISEVDKLERHCEKKDFLEVFGNALSALKSDVISPVDKDLNNQTLTRQRNLTGFLKTLIKLETAVEEQMPDEEVFVKGPGAGLPGSAIYRIVEKWIKVGPDGKISFRNCLRSERKNLTEWIASNKKEASPLMMHQFEKELVRFMLLLNLYKLLQLVAKKALTPSGEQERLAQDIFMVLNGKEEISPEIEEKVKGMMLELQKVLPDALGITDMERITIVQAMGLSKGHWFKCPQDHIYAIGECGGAMQQVECPECKNMGINQAIGGTSHRLTEGNRLASEMDGAQRAAWPQGP